MRVMPADIYADLPTRRGNHRLCSKGRRLPGRADLLELIEMLPPPCGSPARLMDLCADLRRNEEDIRQMLARLPRELGVSIHWEDAKALRVRIATSSWERAEALATAHIEKSWAR